VLCSVELKDASRGRNVRQRLDDGGTALGLGAAGVGAGVAGGGDDDGDDGGDDDLDYGGGDDGSPGGGDEDRGEDDDGCDGGGGDGATDEADGHDDDDDVDGSAGGGDDDGSAGGGDEGDTGIGDDAEDDPTPPQPGGPGGGGPQMPAPPPEGTPVPRAWSRRRFFRLHPHTGMNVLIYALRASSQKLGFNTVNAAFEADLRLTAESGPPNNLYPMTLKQVKSVVGVSTDHSAFLRDACNGPEGEAPYAGCGLFPIRQPGEEDPAEVCPACKTPRYLPRRNAGGLLVARNPLVHVFPVADTVQALFDDLSWCEARYNFDRAGDRVGLFSGTYFKDVDRARGGDLLTRGANGEWRTLVLEVGSDGVTAYKTSKNNQDVWALRAVDVGPESRGKVRFHKLLALAQNKAGSSAVPRSLRPYLSEFRDAIAKYSTGPGLPVVDARRARAGLDPNVSVNLLWLTFSGDTPKVTEAMNAHGHNAYFGCIYCFFTACWVYGIRFLGYLTAQMQKPGSKAKEHVVIEYAVDGLQTVSSAGGAPALKLIHSAKEGVTSLLARDAQPATHALLHAAAVRGARLSETRSHLEDNPLVNGYSIFHDNVGNPLPHVDLAHACLQPVWHKMLYGVGKLFLELVFQPFAKEKTKDAYIEASAPSYIVRNAKRGVIASRAKHVILPAGCSRPYYDIAKHWKTYTMEEFLVFWTSLAPYILRGAWTENDSDDCYKMVIFFHRACMFYFDGTHPRPPGSIEQAAEWMHEFAKLGERVFPERFFTHNLHNMVCHLSKAELATGSVGSTSEMWVERFVRYIVRILDGRATREASAFIVNEEIFRSTVHTVAAKYGVDLFYAGMKRTTAPSGLRDVVTATERYFSSAGVELHPSDFSPDTELGDELGRYFEALPLPNNADFAAEVQTGVVKVVEFQTAAIDGLEMHAATYTLSTKRDSKHAAILYSRNDGTREWYARMDRFYMVHVRGEVHRVVFVSVFKLLSRPTGTRPFAVVDPTNILSRETSSRVVSLDVISRLVILCALDDRHGTAGAVAAVPEKRSMVLPYLKN
jgi:hypothetical protein